MGVAEFRSTSIFITLSLPLYCVATSSTTGANARHGPHQAAQKSTKTGCSAWSTSCSNVASLTSKTPGPAMFLLHSLAEHSIHATNSASSNDAEKRQKVHITQSARSLTATGAQSSPPPELPTTRR